MFHRVRSALGEKERGTIENVASSLRSCSESLQGCSLAAFVEAMQAHFSLDPPVYSKPKHSLPAESHPSHTLSIDYTSRPPPPIPSSSSPQPAAPHKYPSSSDDRPLLPPKPTSYIGSSTVTNGAVYSPEKHQSVSIGITRFCFLTSDFGFLVHTCIASSPSTTVTSL